MGTVVMAMQYNAAASPFATKGAMENSDYAISARFDKNMLYGIECKAGSTAQNRFYTRSGNVSGTMPLSLTDMGLFQISTAPSSSYPTDATIGELWVTYDIEYFIPRASYSNWGSWRMVGGPYANSAPWSGTMSATSHRVR
jgi:hypothetical protein